MEMDYKFKEDVTSVLVIKQINIDSFCKECNVPKRTMFYSFSHTPSNSTLENTYSFIYKLGIKLNKVKSEFLNEDKKQNEIVLFHGSKSGITSLTHDGSRKDCDFGPGLYLTQSLFSAVSFVNVSPNSSVYVFKLDVKDLNVYEFECDLDWMLLISLNRGKINNYSKHKLIENILDKIEKADLLIGPIADNKMFEIMSSFANGEITTTQALHSLSASRLGKQYVIKTKKALSHLSFVERLYLCNKEREDSLKSSKDEELLIQTKLDFAKRNYRNDGQYIDEVLK